ncbi:hypothetical protein PHJA_000173900 [Phtheirospermum japonicum]|uniref:Enhancer of polycomb-like protein n=1 Tax=Phtheirospermum japonicum TaxID=374723 RepID=A0A830B882_9LAMI|nr:hypothetical protein PHJA_000173900 [Phtheirospermum japonicum]
MENSTKKSGGVVIPKKKRSLDLKSLYESRLSEVGGCKKNDSGENEQEDVKKKKRKIRKEVPLSSFESDAKKRKKEDEDGTKSELGFREKLDGWSKELHGISLALGDNGSAFNIPKRPRGSIGRKKLESDPVSDPLRLSSSVDRVGSFKADVSKSEKKGGPSDQLVKPVTFSARKDDVSKSRLAEKVVGPNIESKRKVDAKSTVISTSSIVKPKKKVGADEAVDRVGAFKAEVTKFEDKGGPTEPPVRLVTLSAGNDVTGKVIGLKKKPKPKADPKSTTISSSSNVKLKKKVGADEAVDRVGAEVTKSEDKGGPNNQPVKPITLSSGNHVARKVFDLNKKPKRKAEPKHTMNSDSSNVKLKKKVVADEAIVTKSEDKGGPNDQSVRPVIFSAGTNVAGKVIAFNKKSKRKGDPKSTMSSSCSSVKLKNKVGAFEAEVIKSEDKGGPNNQSVRSVTPSAGNDVAGKVVGLNKNSKRKGDPKSTMNSASSNAKVKKKVGADEAVDRVVAFETEVTKFEDKGGPNDHSVRSVTLPAGNDVRGKVVGLKKKPKQKADPKSTMVSSSSNVISKKKVGADEAIDRVGAFEAEVTKSEDKGGPKDQSVRLVTLSAGNDVAEIVFDLNKKPKRKAERKLTMNSSSSNAKLKKKVGADEAVDRVGAFAAEVIKSEDKGVPNDQFVRSVTPFTDNDEAGKVVGLSKKSKRKADSKSTMFPSSSNKKLKKVGADGAIVRVEAFKAEVTIPEDKGGPIDESVRPATLSLGENGVSHSRLAGKVVGSNTKSKRKADAKSTTNSSSSNVKLKQKVGADEVKVKTDGLSDSVRHVVEESNPVVNNGDTPSKKRLSNSRKKKELVVGGDGAEASIKKPEPAVASPVSNIPFIDSLDDDDDDEENLERNAARMLSSRFDPSCTGFSSKRKSSVSQTGDDLSFPVLSARDSTSRRANSLGGGGEFDSGDDNSRGLRPRGGDKSNGVSRKRRHFYEIPRGDLDPSWALNRRIKIFWPLDESWYFGHVTDYHSEAKLHHLKYDDGEEEWVNLEEENFRLLLHRIEVPGKGKSRKRSSVVKDTRAEETVPPADDDSCVKIDPDSEPIASWLASQSQRVKAVSKSSKRRKMVSSLSSEKTGNSNGNADALKLTGKGPGCESTSADKIRVSGTVVKSLSLRNGKHAVYVRKRYSKKSFGSSSVSRGAKARGNDVMVSLSITKGDMLGCVSVEGSDKQLWSFDEKGKLTLNDLLLESKEIRIQICLPLLPYLEFSCGISFSQLFHDIFMLQHGVIMTTSPAVFLKMFVVDSNLGLRSIVFEGCLMEALAIVFLILTVFSHSDDHCSGEVKLPVTSIRFQLSSVHDQCKQRAFAFYSFSRLEMSRWVYLESKILQQSRLIKQLSVSECTYGNIQELECGILQPCKTRAGSELSPREDFRKKFERGILPMGVSEEARTRMSQSAFCPTGKPGNGPQFTLSFSAASNIFLSLHLQSLMKQGSVGSDLQNQDPLLSPESSENGGEPVAECSQSTEHENRQSEMGVVLARNATKNTSSSAKLQKGLSSDQLVDTPFARKGCIHDGFVHNSNTVGSKSSSKRRRSSTISSLLGHLSPVLADSQPNFMRDGFSNGPKKPRTQVQYSLPLAGYDPSAKQEASSPRSIPCKRIRRASLKKISDGSGNNQKNLELQTCFSNVLVTHGDKGWRECGANIVLEFSDHNEWRLAVKISGLTKFSYKVTHILQPGSTNRYSHAVIWKGGKDWVLEFPDRSQWVLFKEMYEECYNRNIRAASVKNIPIPGVRLVEENDDYGDEVPFVRNSIMYFRQVQTDAEMAMDPSHILYDMDSDDEQWLMTHKNCTANDIDEEISEEFFEMAMDMFEKVSYAQRRDNLTDAEIEEIAIVIGSVEAARLIYLHWRHKREKMRMPLIRHLQLPPWQRYQKQVKEWENSVARSGQEKLPLPEKPPMFAFCFKPRGLDVPNKPSKQRSHRRLSVSGLHLASPGDHSHLVSGRRRSNGQAYGDEKSLYASNIYDSSDVSPSLRPSTRMLSSRDAHFTLNASVSEWKANNNNRNSHKKKQKKKPQRTTPNGDTTNGAQPWNMGPSELSGGSKPPGISDLHEYHVRDALGASQHARAMAKLKRERAQKMFCKADLAMNKAVSALMQAEAIKDSLEKNGAVN